MSEQDGAASLVRSDALLAIFRKALEDIASYGHDGICPYGCDTPNIAREALKHKGESSPAPDGSALVEALRDTHRHIEELERIQAESPRCVMTHEAKERAKMLTERIIALSPNAGAVPRRGSDVGTSPLLGQKSEEV